MFGKERQQKEGRHRIILDTYTGVESAHLQLNKPVSNAFMSVTDMRADIFITNRKQRRQHNIEELGDTLIGKSFFVPSLSLRKTKYTETLREGDQWIIAVDDQQLVQDISSKKTTAAEKQNAFIKEFKHEVHKGLHRVLVAEKLGNSGEFSYAFVWNYFNLLMTDVALIPALANQGIDAGDPQGAASICLQFFFLTNMLVNGANNLMADNPEIPSYIGKAKRPRLYEPFVRLNKAEVFLPPVPVDRLVRGSLYLRKHKDELIQTADRND
jgi:hypothetical protein